MIITQLELMRFKKFLNKTIQFTPGLNIIRGPNESGKSTIRHALTAALFGNPTSSSEAVRSLTTWGHSERCELKLEFTDNNGVVCKLRKDFASNKIFMHRGEETFRTLKSIQEQIAESLGIMSEELFNLCTSLDVRSLANLGNAANRKQIGSMLAGLMTGTSAGPDIILALKRLDEAIRELGKGERSVAKNPGHLKITRDLLGQVKTQYLQAQSALQNRRTREVALENVSLKLKENNEQLADLKHLLDSNDKLLRTRERKRELVQQDQDFERRMQERTKLEKNLKEIQAALNQDPLAGMTPETIAHLQTMQTRCQQLEKAEPQAPSGNTAIPWMFGLGGFLGLFGMIAITFNWILGLLIFFGGLGISITGWLKKSAVKTLQHNYEINKDAWEKEVGKPRREIEQFLITVPPLTLEDVFRLWPKTQQIKTEKHLLLKHLSEFQTIDEERWQTIRRELRMLEDLLQDTALAALVLAPEALAARQREFQIKSSLVTEMNNEKSKLQGLLEHELIHQDSVLDLEERITEIQGQLMSLEKRERVLNLAYQLMDQARRDTLNPARKILEKRAGELMATFSQGRYQNIAVDDEDLSSKIVIPETGKWENPEVLSQGAFDQFYLSLRLALAEVLSSGQKSPLLLDEPLAAFDPERAHAALRCLKLLANERQILFFTCRPDYDAAADRLILLN